MGNGRKRIPGESLKLENDDEEDSFSNKPLIRVQHYYYLPPLSLIPYKI